MTSTTPHDQPAAPVNRDSGAEAAAHSLLRLIADYPGRMGRLRAARIVGGYPTPDREGEPVVHLATYAVQLDWPLREITRLVDALDLGGLFALTPGPRPTLVLTRAGFRSLDALDSFDKHRPPTDAQVMLAGMHRAQVALAMGDTDHAQSLLADYIGGAEQVDGVTVPGVTASDLAQARELARRIMDLLDADAPS